MVRQCTDRPPMPFKRFKNWNYCSTHSGDIVITHTSKTCHWPGPNHNPLATRMNTMGGSAAGLHKTILPSAAGQAPPPPQQQRAPTQAMWPPSLPPATFTSPMAMICLMMPAAPNHQAIYHVSQQMGPQALYHGGQQMGPPPPYGAVHAPPALPQGTMMYPSYMAYQQSPPFWLLGTDDAKIKIKDDVNFTFPCSIPTRNYALTASVLLNMINTNADTIKSWAILNSGAISHIRTTDVPATNILPTTTSIISCLPNGTGVHSMHMCTLNIPPLPPNARTPHIIPSLALHSLLSVVNLCNAGCTVHFTKIGKPLSTAAIPLFAVTHAQGGAYG